MSETSRSPQADNQVAAITDAKAPGDSSNTSLTPVTYEDCVTLINEANASDDIGATKAALKKLLAFFQARMGRKNAESEKDGTTAVKRAVQAGRTFKSYEAKPATEASNVINPFAS